MTRSEVVMFVLAVFVLVAVGIVGPLLLIWSINTLFAREIPYDFTNWCAAFVMIGVLRSTCRCRKESKADG